MQKIPLDWSVNGIHPSKYHAAMLKMIKQARGMELRRITNKFMPYMIQPDNRECAYAIVEDLMQDEMLYTFPETIKLRGKEVRREIYALHRNRPVNGYYTNSLYMDCTPPKPHLIPEPINKSTVSLQFKARGVSPGNRMNLQNFLQVNKNTGMRDIMRTFRNIMARELKDILSEMESNGQVKIIKEKQETGKGRPKTVIRWIEKEVDIINL